MAALNQEENCICEYKQDNGNQIRDLVPSNIKSSDTALVPFTSQMSGDFSKKWLGNNEESWSKTIPERPQVFDWRKNNSIMYKDIQNAHNTSYLTEYNIKISLIQTGMDGDRNQKITKENLSNRCMNIHSYMKLIEESIDKLDEDLHLLGSRKQRLRSAMLGIAQVDNINQECIHIRTLRMENDNLIDQPYQELIQENNMVQDLSQIMTSALNRISEQIKLNQAIKSKLQLDLSNKKQAYEIDTHNLGLNINSSSILFRSSSARVPESQSTPISWENYTKEYLNEAETILSQSTDLICYLDGPILSQYIKDIKIQSDKVNDKLIEKVCSIDNYREQLELELRMVVNHLGETETVIADLKNLIQNLEKALKVAQTRLDNRLARIEMENCKDDVQAGLLEEVKHLTSQISISMSQLKQAETTQNGLLYTRNKLEYEIQVKRKSISVDNDRISRVRQHYPALSTLSGY